MFWNDIDWTRPWLAPYRDVGQRAVRTLTHGAHVFEALNEVAEDSLPGVGTELPRFVPQHQLPKKQAYECFIDQTNSVPSRDNLHDLFNGLVWLIYPSLKHFVIRLQVEQIKCKLADGRHVRTAVGNALTLFDENGAIWQTPHLLANALRERNWAALFLEHRGLWRQAHPVIFGHALLEKLVHPRKTMTAHVWLVPERGMNASDWLIRQRLNLSADVVGKSWLPLPVLGVPGWWHDNVSEAFYEDESVFRPVLASPEKHAARQVSLGRTAI